MSECGGWLVCLDFLKVLLNFEMPNEMLHCIFWIPQKSVHPT